MKIIAAFILLALAGTSTEWQHDFKNAQKEAIQKNRLILLNFSGSDWCIPCMRLKKEIFNSEVFNQMAIQQLELVNADFPRLKKNQSDKEQIKRNEELAEKYNPEGKFPFTVLLD